MVKRLPEECDCFLFEKRDFQKKMSTLGQSGQSLNGARHVLSFVRRFSKNQIPERRFYGEPERAKDFNARNW